MRIKHEARELTYRAYITDILRMIGENAAASGRYYGADGAYIRDRYMDILHPKPEETRTAQEVIDHVTSRMKGGVRDKSV